jgi:predicted permease
LNKKMFLAIESLVVGLLLCGFFLKKFLQTRLLSQDITWILILLMGAISLTIISIFVVYSLWRWKKVRKEDVFSGFYVSGFIVAIIVAANWGGKIYGH